MSDRETKRSTENALRVAHRQLHFDIRAEYPATQVPAARSP
jgi:hypothetical protein